MVNSNRRNREAQSLVFSFIARAHQYRNFQQILHYSEEVFLEIIAREAERAPNAPSNPDRLPSPS